MKNLKWIITAIVAVMLSACGYQFEGGGYLADDVKRVYVDGFENKSSETGAGIAFTNALIEEIIRISDTRVVDKDQAEFIIQAQVNSITFSVLSRSTTDAVTERRASASVDLKILDKDNEIVWSVKDFTIREDYSVSDDVVTDEANKADAVAKIAVKSAEQLVSRMLSNF
jgi:outer membrane lipopolysaccharide assembly protein LptE/RlpB